MKVMLLFPNWTSNYGIASRFGRRIATWQPLNLALLAAIAEEWGHEVRIIDGQAENISVSEMVERTEAFKPDIIGMTGASPFYYTAVELATELKKVSKVPIVIGGAHITILKEEAFNECFDYGFIGEADRSFPMFLEHYEKGQSIGRIRGILSRNNSEVMYTGKATPVDDIDTIPLPARHLLKMDKYTIGTLQGRKNFTSIMFSRGCPFSCIFCSTGILGKKVRRRVVESVVDEIASVVSEFNVRHFVFADDNLTLDRNYILVMCQLIKQRKLPITFEGGTRANLVDEELVREMASAGMIRLSFGLETADEPMRKTAKKNVPLDSYVKANRLLNKYDIECLNSIMVGLPGETHETLNKTLSFVNQNRDIKQCNSSIAIPYPGTELYEMARRGEHGLKLLTQNFSEYMRYGSAVMSVGDLSPNDLIKMQNKTFISIYSAYWRWIPVLRRGGLVNIFLTFCQLVVSIGRNLFKR